MFAKAGTGVRYSINDSELNLLQSSLYGAQLRPLPRPISMRDAAERLFAPHPIKQTAEYRAAWNRILPTCDQELTWDLLVKMFNDLDTVVFHGDLRYRVCLQWTDMRMQGMEGEIGYTEPPGDYNVGRISIYMSSDADWSSYPQDYALGVLLHEMLHAYFMVWCRDNTVEMMFEPSQHPGHGVIFMAAARKIGRKMAADLTSTPEELLSGMLQASHSRFANTTMRYPATQSAPFMANMFAPAMAPWQMPIWGIWR